MPLRPAAFASAQTWIRNSFCRGNQEEVDARNDVLEKYESMNHWADELFGKQKRVNFEMKNFILKLLCFEKGTDQSFGEILATMEWLKIHNAFLCAARCSVFGISRARSR